MIHPDHLQAIMRFGLITLGINYAWPFLLMCLRFVREFYVLPVN